MTDWVSTSLDAVWLVGLAVLLAGVGWSEWLSTQRYTPLRRVLDQSLTVRLGLIAGVALLGLGVGAVSDRWWEQGLWGVLFLVALRDGWGSWRASRRARD